jgi:hypothetical protein
MYTFIFWHYNLKKLPFNFVYWHNLEESCSARHHWKYGKCVSLQLKMIFTVKIQKKENTHFIYQYFSILHLSVYINLFVIYSKYLLFIKSTNDLHILIQVHFCTIYVQHNKGMFARHVTSDTTLINQMTSENYFYAQFTSTYLYHFYFISILEWKYILFFRAF